MIVGRKERRPQSQRVSIDRMMTTRRSAGEIVSSNTKKLFKLTVSVFRPRFDASRCKTAAKMTVARIKLLRNKKEVVIRQMRRDIALLLRSGQDSTARVRVEHVIREQNVLAANEFIELFCELIVSRLTIISKQRDCPADLKEGISSLLFAGPRCSEIPELVTIRKIFEKKYGADFVSAAIDLRPNCGVNRTLIEKLSVKTPSGEVKLKLMKEIAKEYQVEWDASESEKELLKSLEERTEGPCTFVSASTMPVEKGAPTEPYADTAAAAEAAAQSARQAIEAAKAAALIAKKDVRKQGEFDEWVSDECHFSRGGDGALLNGRRHSCGGMREGSKEESGRRHSCHPFTHDEEAKFDESPPAKTGYGHATASRVHPNLPNYEDLNARFNSLKRL